MSRVRSHKRDVERAKQERAAAKREKRAARADEGSNGESVDASGPAVSQEQLLAQLAELHEQYDAGTLSLEALEAAREEIVQRLVIS